MYAKHNLSFCVWDKPHNPIISRKKFGFYKIRRNQICRLIIFIVAKADKIPYRSNISWLYGKRFSKRDIVMQADVMRASAPSAAGVSQVHPEIFPRLRLRIKKTWNGNESTCNDIRKEKQLKNETTSQKISGPDQRLYASQALRAQN